MMAIMHYLSLYTIHSLIVGIDTHYLLRKEYHLTTSLDFEYHFSSIFHSQSLRHKYLPYNVHFKEGRIPFKNIYIETRNLAAQMRYKPSHLNQSYAPRVPQEIHYASMHWQWHYPKTDSCIFLPETLYDFHRQFDHYNGTKLWFYSFYERLEEMNQVEARNGYIPRYKVFFKIPANFGLEFLHIEESNEKYHAN